MKSYTFGFEVQTLLEQFISAFNDVVVKRYNNNTAIPPLSGIKVNYVYSPKQRVFNSLQNPAPGGITVPVIAVNISGISRDQTRVFNKNEGFKINLTSQSDGVLAKKILQPVPVNININMTIITKYQADMDQILTNFIPYCDPYIVISWKIPQSGTSTKNSYEYEIRSEVLWNGNLQINYPQDIGPNQPFRITADTSFTIKGWMFKNSTETIKRIYTIHSSYIDQNFKDNDEFLIDFDEFANN
jgi:hypothetical protein